jgi:hypothetical protein
MQAAPGMNPHWWLLGQIAQILIMMCLRRFPKKPRPVTSGLPRKASTAKNYPPKYRAGAALLFGHRPTHRWPISWVD